MVAFSHPLRLLAGTFTIAVSALALTHAQSPAERAELEPLVAHHGDFSRTRSVDLTVARNDVETIRVMCPQGNVLYRGPAKAQLSVDLPAKHRTLIVTTTNESGDREHHSLPVRDDAAQL